MSLSTNKYQLDNHKLQYHPERVTKFLQTGDCYPLYIEISPVGSCNHRCIFCAYDFIGYPNRKLDKEVLLHFIDEMAECGIKSALYAGEGEPLLHPNIDEFVERTALAGIDVGMFSNGQLLKESLAEKILLHLTFLRFSFNGGNAKTYSEIHKVKEKVFDSVVANISYASKIKKEQNLKLDLGAQFVLLPENMDSVIEAAKVIKQAGLNYFVIKPFVHQNSSQGYKLEEFYSFDKLNEIEAKLNEFNDANFQVQFRVNAFSNYGKRDYDNCYGTSFITALNSAGELASCLPYWDQQDFIFGNIHQNTLQEIWAGDKRKNIKMHLENDCIAKSCPPNCRPNAINKYLWQLKSNEVKHINFI